MASFERIASKNYRKFLGLFRHCFCFFDINSLSASIIVSSSSWKKHPYKRFSIRETSISRSATSCHR